MVKKLLSWPLGIMMALGFPGCSKSVSASDVLDAESAESNSESRDRPEPAEDSSIQTDIADVGDVERTDVVEIADRPTVGPAMRFARIDVIRTPVGSLESDAVEAWIVVPQRPDGSGYSAQRSGDCVVENLTYPPFERFADNFFFTAGPIEREVSYRDIHQTMRWSELGNPLIGASQVSFRAVRSDFAMPWTFTASIPPPVLRFTSPIGIEQFPMPNLFLELTDTVAFRWTPHVTSRLVQIQFDTTLLSPPPMPYSHSFLRCLYDGRLGTASIRLGDHPAWRNRNNFRSGTVLTVDALEQHLVPYGDVMVEVNMMHRHGSFAVTIPPSM